MSLAARRRACSFSCACVGDSAHASQAFRWTHYDLASLVSIASRGYVPQRILLSTSEPLAALLDFEEGSCPLPRWPKSGV